MPENNFMEWNTRNYWIANTARNFHNALKFHLSSIIIYIYIKSPGSSPSRNTYTLRTYRIWNTFIGVGRVVY